MNIHPCFYTYLLVVGLAMGISASPAYSDDAQGSRDRGIGVSLSATPVYQFNADLDGGGNLSVMRAFFTAGTRRKLSESLTAGLSLKYDAEDYDFSGTTDLLGNKPWDKINRPGAGAIHNYQSINGWKASLAPKVEFSRESGASWRDSLGYGAVFILSRGVHPDLELGLGLGAFSGIEKNTIIPVLKVDWKITEHFRLSNPARSNPVGPAGLALSYTPDKRWEFALAGAFRRFRFRLDDSGPAPDGVGEASMLPVLLRATRKFGPLFRLDAYAGAAFRGQLKLEDEDGDQLRADNHDAAPMLGMTLSGRF